MLVNLVIDNIAVIEHTDIDFSAGFNVMTGETGAGKSIVIDSINAILGERTSRELIRHGAERASVTAVFDRIPSGVSARLEEYGIEAEESELIISRVISSEGKNKCHINGRPVTVSVLRDIAGDLINIHGQHDSQSLLDSEKHIRFIDAYAQNSDILDQYRAAYRNYCTIRRELSRLKMDEQEKQRRTELLEYQIKELEEAGIVPGERDRLEERRNWLRTPKR